MAQAPRELIRNDVVLKSVRRANVAADYWISGMTLTSFFLFLPFFLYSDPITRNSDTMAKCCILQDGGSFDNAIGSSYGNSYSWTDTKEKNLKTFNKPP